MLYAICLQFYPTFLLVCTWTLKKSLKVYNLTGLNLVSIMFLRHFTEEVKRAQQSAVVQRLCLLPMYPLHRFDEPTQNVRFTVAVYVILKAS